MFELQVTRPTSAASAASKPSPPKDSKDTQDRAAGSSPGSQAEEAGGPEVPPVSTLLEFVAWVVLTGHPVGTKAVEDWGKGRGGYLMDELDRVREASIRVQVFHPSLYPSCKCLELPFSLLLRTPFEC